MYLSYYHLSEWPFQIYSDPRFLWLGEKHKEALATLVYGVENQRGFLLLTGDVGTGKTTLVNALLERLDRSILVGNITDPNLDLMGFLNVVSASLGCFEKSERKEDFLIRFTRFLNETYRANKYVLLIIDEAHKLSSDHLEQIRLLSNIELPEKRLISIFLVGQNEINQKLTSYECRALRQRITLICRVEPLSEGETNEYIRHRLKVAGTDREIFSQAAIREIQRVTCGYPRLINNLCDHALLTGYVRQLDKITPGVIKECREEMLLPGEQIESSFHTFSENVEQPPLVNSGELSERPQENRLAHSEIMRENDFHRMRAFWSRAKTRFLLYWSLGACAALVILFVTLIFQSDLFSGRDGKGAVLSESSPAVSQVSSSSPLPRAPLEETPVAKDEEPRIKAVGDPANVQPKDLAEAETDSHIYDGAEKPPRSKEVVPETREKGVIDSVEDALRRRDFNRAIELSEKFFAKDASPAPKLKVLYLDALLKQAEALSEKDIIASENLLTRAISADPRNLQALLLLGKVYTGQKRYGKALEIYQKATELNPAMPGLFFNLGFLYAAKDDYALAEGAFMRAIELSPPYLDKALFNLAVIQERQGKRAASLQSLRKALEVNPNNQKARELFERLTEGAGDRS